jgi:DNA-binding NarL/FixJ family response regulator
MKKTKIFIVDDHQLVRDGIKALLEGEQNLEVVGEAADGISFYAQLETAKPDVILMDISLPGASGVEITAKLTESDPEIRVIILSMYTQDDFVLKALKAGAMGYLPKNTTREEMIAAIHSVVNGEEYLSEQISKVLLKSLIRKAQQDPEEVREDKSQITARESEILRLLAEGLSNQDIADRLFISVRTVESHKNHIMQKLGIKSNIELVKYLARQGFIEI